MYVTNFKTTKMKQLNITSSSSHPPHIYAFLMPSPIFHFASLPKTNLCLKILAFTPLPPFPLRPPQTNLCIPHRKTGNVAGYEATAIFDRILCLESLINIIYAYNMCMQMLLCKFPYLGNIIDLEIKGYQAKLWNTEKNHIHIHVCMWPHKTLSEYTT